MFECHPGNFQKKNLYRFDKYYNQHIGNWLIMHTYLYIIRQSFIIIPIVSDLLMLESAMWVVTVYMGYDIIAIYELLYNATT